MNEETLAKWREFRDAFERQAKAEVAYLVEDEMGIILDEFEQNLNDLMTVGGY